jgi:hypothetical protein
MFRDPFDRMNNLFANFDVMFRELEKDFGVGNLLPHVTVPSVKTYYKDHRAVDDGEKVTFYPNGRVHRLDGPAVMWNDDSKEEWWLDGKQVTQEEVEKERQRLADEQVHNISVDGRTYEVTGKQLRELKNQLKLAQDES